MILECQSALAEFAQQKFVILLRWNEILPFQFTFEIERFQVIGPFVMDTTQSNATSIRVPSNEIESTNALRKSLVVDTHDPMKKSIYVCFPG
jgi:hypothetical protein